MVTPGAPWGPVKTLMEGSLGHVVFGQHDVSELDSTVIPTVLLSKMATQPHGTLRVFCLEMSRILSDTN